MWAGNAPSSPACHSLLGEGAGTQRQRSILRYESSLPPSAREGPVAIDACGAGNLEADSAVTACPGGPQMIMTTAESAANVSAATVADVSGTATSSSDVGVILGSDPLDLEAVDALELWVGNARQASHFYRTGWGFRLVAYAGPETGVRDQCSYVLEQGRLRFVVTSSMREGTEIARHVARHGDGIRDIVLRVADAPAAFAEAVRRGAVPVRPPWEEKDDYGIVRRATIAAFGETVHTFVERSGYGGVYAPGFEARETVPDPLPAPGLVDFDHSVANVELNRMNFWVEFYEKVLGFRLIQGFTDDDISTEYSALMSKVVSDGVGRIKFPINEPAPGKKRSQVDEYLDFYNGPGVQHVAIGPTTSWRLCRRWRPAASSSCVCPTRIMTTCASVSPTSISTSTSCSDAPSWLTAMTRATCCRSSPA